MILRLLWAYFCCNCFCLYRMLVHYEAWQMEMAHGVYGRVPDDVLVIISAAHYENGMSSFDPRAPRKFFYLHPELVRLSREKESRNSY